MEKIKWNKAKLIEASGSYWKICAIHTAVKLNVFTILAGRKLTALDIAKETNTDKRAVTMLLNALVALNLLSKADNTYSNTKESNALLSKDSSDYLGYILMHHHHTMDSWMRLDQAIKTGKPLREREAYREEEFRENFLMGMFNLAMDIAPKIVSLIDASKRRHLLDLGGGPGTYAIHFCLKNPKLKATVFDLPQTRPFAEKTIAKFNLADRINFIGGDYLIDSIKGSYDLALLSHILHSVGPQDCQRIINKVVSALMPGSMVIIHDFILNDTMDGPLFPALFSLNMLLGTQEGQAYSEKQIIDMLEKAGIKEIKRIAFDSPNDSGIITGIVKK